MADTTQKEQIIVVKDPQKQELLTVEPTHLYDRQVNSLTAAFQTINNENSSSAGNTDVEQAVATTKGKLHKIREKLFALKEKLQPHLGGKSKEGMKVTEAEIKLLEAELGIENDSERILEASLFIDKKFMDAAIITGLPQPERMFGNETWADYLEARIMAKRYGDQDLTVEFIKNLHIQLTKRTVPEIGGVLRQGQCISCDYDGGIGKSTPEQFGLEEVTAIENNPYLTFQKMPGDKGTGHIVYPYSRDIYLEKYNLSDKARALYVQNGSSTEVLLEAMLTDVCDWYNKEKHNPGFSLSDLAAELQNKLISIHGFKDYCGRLSRVLMNWSLENKGEAPAILSDPTKDIVLSSENWSAQVRDGIERYNKIEGRKKQLDKAGLNDIAELMGLEEEKTFYDYVFKHISKQPQLTGRALISHRSAEDFLSQLHSENKRFNSDFSLDSDVEFFPSKFSSSIIGRVHQGGLIPSSYIDFIGKKNSTVDGNYYMRKRYFTPEEVYRGGQGERPLDQQDLLRMMSEFVPATAAYRPIKEAQLIGSAFHTIPPDQVQRSLRDYNQLLASAYLARNHRLSSAYPLLETFKRDIQVGVNPLRVLADRVSGRGLARAVNVHTLAKQDQVTSIFTSTSTIYHEASRWSKHYIPDTDPKTQIPDKDGHIITAAAKFGLVITALVPQNGSILTFYPNYSDDNPQPEVGEKFVGTEGAEFEFMSEREVQIPGGIDPRAINRIEFYDTSHVIKRPQDAKKEDYMRYMGENLGPSITAARELSEGQDIIIIVDYRSNQDGVTTKYLLNDTTGKYESYH